MIASVRTLGQAYPTFGKKLPEGFAAHHEVSDGFSRGFLLAVRRGEADEVHDCVVDDDFDVSEKQCRLHAGVPALMSCPPKDGPHHALTLYETIRKAVSTAFDRNGFHRLSIFISTDLAALGNKTAECLFGHRGANLQPGLMLLAGDRRKFGPKEQPNNIFLDDLNSEARHEETGQRLRFGKFRHFVVTVGFHFFSSSTSTSRAVSPVTRDRRRPKAGMVAPAPSLFGVVGHHFFPSSRSSLLSPKSVAGNGDSNERFAAAQKLFARQSKAFCTRSKNV